MSWIQTRCKAQPDAALWRALEEIRRWLARRRRASEDGPTPRWWVNDRADIAALVAADGLHLGQDDMAAADARSVLGEAVWIGRSTHDRGELEAAAADPAVDVIAVGPIFPTASKIDPRPVVGLEFVRWARARTAKPLVGIGGVDEHRVASVLSAGADAVAVLGAICRGDVEANARRLLAAAGEAAAGRCASI